VAGLVSRGYFGSTKKINNTDEEKRKGKPPAEQILPSKIFKKEV
jgi:hypothetical protein